MPFSNPIAGGTALARNALNSPNFQTGVQGWSINRDGSAEFNSGTFRGGLAVGVSPNPRLTLGTSIPADLQAFYTAQGTPVAQALIYYVNATDYYYQANVAAPNVFYAQGISVSGTVHETQLIHWSAFDGEVFWELGVDETLLIDVGSPIRAPSLDEFWHFNASMSLYLRGPTQAVGIDADVSGAKETWHALSLNAPWTNRGAGFPVLSYRRVPSPNNSVQICGQLTSGGAASGSVIANLPSGYRPLTAIGGAAGNDGNADILIEVETNGDIKAFGVFGTHIQINDIIPLDL